MKSLKFVFDFRNLQQKELIHVMREQLNVVKAGEGESAVFFLQKEINAPWLKRRLRSEFILAHVEQVAVTDGIPYQIIRLQRPDIPLENVNF